MKLDLFVAGKMIGSLLRSGSNVLAWRSDGTALGQFSDMDAAAAALLRLDCQNLCSQT